ncbi:calcium-independent phospholipase A2-gamma-like [Tachypleus tridentatus]|uniref:calcium-independent phospholipase A2-gamma-like n=1 Tax=Tachypleus tridentatus TaxID=6853 RepID=UPI003FD4632E
MAQPPSSVRNFSFLKDVASRVLKTLPFTRSSRVTLLPASSSDSEKPSQSWSYFLTNNLRHVDFKKLSDLKQWSLLTFSLRPSAKTLSSKTNKKLEASQDNKLEKALTEWVLEDVSYDKPAKQSIVDSKKVKSSKMRISKLELDSRSKFLVKSLSGASSVSSQLSRLEGIHKHLLLYPESVGMLMKAKVIPVVLHLRERTHDTAVICQAREVLTLLGYVDPPKGKGIRILSIDGGGIRGILAIEIMRYIEAKTGKRIHQLFDYLCGVSTGAILCMLLGGLNLTLDECENLYRKMSEKMFTQNTWLGTGRLMWSHAFYDTSLWVGFLTSIFNERTMIESARDPENPKIGVVSTVLNQPTLQAFVFRNYGLPARVTSQYLGGCNHKMWQAVRASAAAPGYFEEYQLDDMLHQDGGLMMNNPTAVAVHESRLLWPQENIQCIISIGNGRHIPFYYNAPTSSSLKMKVVKIVDSATNTEGTHTVLNDLLPGNSYFRLNPYLSEPVTLDENRPNKLEQLKTDAQMYIRRNEHKVLKAIASLSESRGYLLRMRDYLYLVRDLKC